MFSNHMTACRAVVVEAGKRLLAMHADYIEEKTDFANLVTSCDKETQEFLVNELAKIDPEATFLCEENDLQDISGSRMFIIDPIDGTSNFIHDLRMSAICVAYADHEEVLWGMIYNPYMDEFFEAEKGKGAYLNGRRIHVLERPLEKCLATFGTSPYYKEWQNETFELARFMKDYVIDLRRTGSAALDLCYIACGRSGLYFERQLCAWDFAAGKCIVQEAGGVMVNFENEVPDHTQKTGAVAGCRANVDRFFELYAMLEEERAKGRYHFQ